MAIEDAGLALVEYTFTAASAPETAFGVRRVSVNEGVSSGYEAEVEITTEDEAFEGPSLLGTSATLRLQRATLERNVFGVIYRVEALGQTASKRVYRVHFGPALNALRYRQNTRIFQDKTLPEILEEVINDGIQRYGSSLELRLTGEYKKLEYCVQYRETDLDFVRRLMQEAGIADWFDHGADRELLILSDSTSDFMPVQTFHEGPLQLLPSHFDRTSDETLQAFHWGQQMVPGEIVVRDYDWTRPGMTVRAEVQDEAPERRHHIVYDAPTELRFYDYAEDKFDGTSVEREASLRQLRGHIRMQNGRGRSNLIGLQPGATFVYGPEGGEQLTYTVTRVTHRGAVEREVASAVGSAQYENDFEFILGGQYFVPERTTPRPRIHSTQTAKVVGPTGEEIHTDEHGRVKVQFHWDAWGENNEQSSCFIRVMQPTAGPGFGHVFLPRIGMEVVVSFLEGNPDRPLITGTVYNGENRPPYALPEHKTRSTIKTNTTPGGGGFNELRFEDKAGEEEIYLHAQKDLNEVVNNDHTTRVGHDQTLDVENNQVNTIGAVQKLLVKEDRSVRVLGVFDETVQGCETRRVEGGVDETILEREVRSIEGDHKEEITGDATQVIGNHHAVTVEGKREDHVLGPAFYKVGGSTLTESGAAYAVEAVGSIICQSGSGITLDGATEITLRAPDITMISDKGVKEITPKKTVLDNLLESCTLGKLSFTGSSVSHTASSMSHTGFSTSGKLFSFTTVEGVDMNEVAGLKKEAAPAMIINMTLRLAKCSVDLSNASITIINGS